MQDEEEIHKTFHASMENDPQAKKALLLFE